jgi:hypothetical protein
MKLQQQIRLKERQAEQAQAAFEQSLQEFSRVVNARLSSKAALALSFSGGWVLGWWRLKRRRRSHSKRITERLGMPPHWLGHHVVWPFLLGTVHDYLLSRRRQS